MESRFSVPSSFPHPFFKKSKLLCLVEDHRHFYYSHKIPVSSLRIFLLQGFIAGSLFSFFFFSNCPPRLPLSCCTRRNFPANPTSSVGRRLPFDSESIRLEVLLSTRSLFAETLERLRAPSRINSVKLAGLNSSQTSFLHPLLGPKFRVFCGGDTRPP